MRRWYCPNCGSGLLAPAKPHRHDARRWCLDCTPRDGMLVRRWRCASATEARELEEHERGLERSRAEKKRVRRANETARKVAESLGAKPEPKQKRRRCNMTKPGPVSGLTHVCKRFEGHKGPHRSKYNTPSGRPYTWK